MQDGGWVADNLALAIDAPLDGARGFESALVRTASNRKRSARPLRTAPVNVRHLADASPAVPGATNIGLWAFGANRSRFQTVDAACFASLESAPMHSFRIEPRRVCTPAMLPWFAPILLGGMLVATGGCERAWLNGFLDPTQVGRFAAGGKRKGIRRKLRV